MKSIFTEGQIRKIISPGGVQWNWNDISNAICLHAAGPRAYTHLYKKGFLLPSVSTLQRWSRKINMSEGITYPAIDFMGQNTELSREETFEYDSVGDVVRKPANYVQDVVARAIWKSWKQPVSTIEHNKNIQKDRLKKVMELIFQII